MIYKITIIDNGNQVSLTQQGGVRSMEGEGFGLMNVDTDIMNEALDKLMEAIKDDTNDN